ncbi:MAG: hypothetical protein WBF04_19940 [Candidatus Sulfotelmatobacter sp.]
MAKKKTKELLVAEYFYAYGRRDALATPPPALDEKEIVGIRAEHALRQWKQEIRSGDNAGARKEWIAAGKPAAGIQNRNGTWHKFKPDGQFDLDATLKANFGDWEE